MYKKVSLFLLLGLLVLSGVSQVAADTQPLALAVGYEQALNLGDIDATTALFADDAAFYSYIGSEAVVGRDAIQEAMALWVAPGRTFDIVAAHMVGNRITLTVDIADRGITWGRQTLQLAIENGLIQSLEPVDFRFLLN